MDIEEFPNIKRNILKKVDKVTRYQNHTAFISTYLRMDSIPKGFKLKFHNNLGFDSSGILKKCSRKLMKRTLTYYQNVMKKLCKQINAYEEMISIHYSTQYEDIKTYITNKTTRLNDKLRNRHNEKFRRDRKSQSKKYMAFLVNREHPPPKKKTLLRTSTK